MYSRESKLPFAVYAYATSVLARGGVSHEWEARDEGGSGRDVARSGRQRHGRAFLRGRRRGGVMLGAAELFFEYDSARARSRAARSSIASARGRGRACSKPLRERARGRGRRRARLPRRDPRPAPQPHLLRGAGDEEFAEDMKGSPWRVSLGRRSWSACLAPRGGRRVTFTSSVPRQLTAEARRTRGAQN